MGFPDQPKSWPVPLIFKPKALQIIQIKTKNQI